jgi:hypothetical protein
MKLVPAIGYVVAVPRLVVKKERSELIGLSNVTENGELVFQVKSGDVEYLDKLIVSKMDIKPSDLNALGNIIPIDTIVGYFEIDEDEEVIDLPTE